MIRSLRTYGAKISTSLRRIHSFDALCEYIDVIAESRSLTEFEKKIHVSNVSHIYTSRIAFFHGWTKKCPNALLPGTAGSICMVASQKTHICGVSLVLVALLPLLTSHELFLF